MSARAIAVRPKERLVSGVRDIDTIVARLREAEAALEDPVAPLFAWGFDPLHIGGRMLTRQDLDRVSTTRPIMVIHASFHISNVNTIVLERTELLARDRYFRRRCRQGRIGER